MFHFLWPSQQNLLPTHLGFTSQGWAEPAQADFFKQVPGLALKGERLLGSTRSCLPLCWVQTKVIWCSFAQGLVTIKDRSSAQTKSNTPRESNRKGEAGACSPVWTKCTEGAETRQESSSLSSRAGHRHASLPYLGHISLTAQLWPPPQHHRPLAQAQPTCARHPGVGEKRWCSTSQAGCSRLKETATFIVKKHLKAELRKPLAVPALCLQLLGSASLTCPTAMAPARRLLAAPAASPQAVAGKHRPQQRAHLG